MWRVALAYFCKTSNIWLNRRHLGRHTYFCIQFVAVCWFSSRIWRKCGLPQIYSWKGRSSLILIAFSDNYRYSSLILHKNTSSYFSKVSCMWYLKLYQQSFQSSPLKSIGFFCTLNGLSMHGFVTPHIGYLNILVHWLTQIFQTSTNFMINYQKLHSLVSPPDFILKVLRSTVVTCFQKF